MDISYNQVCTGIRNMNTGWCILGDCWQLPCHHCFPVKNCSKNHDFCRQYGESEEIFINNHKNPQE